MCEQTAPDVFVVDADGILQILEPEVEWEHHEAVRTAVAGCPTGALSIEDE
jgi:ferredoxin